jgi:hypothetical protein
VWVFDEGREVRVTDDPNWDSDPVWSEDGLYVVYSSRRGDRWRIYRRRATAIGPEEVGLRRVDPGEHYAWLLAKKAPALFRCRAPYATRDYQRRCSPITKSPLRSAPDRFTSPNRARASGVTVPLADVLIFACAKMHGLEVAHDDTRFNNLLTLEA